MAAGQGVALDGLVAHLDQAGFGQGAQVGDAGAGAEAQLGGGQDGAFVQQQVQGLREAGLALRCKVVRGGVGELVGRDQLYITHGLGAHRGAGEAVGAAHEAALVELREGRRDAALLEVALDLARLGPADRGDVGEDGALSRRQGMALDLVGPEEGLVEGEGASLEAGRQREGDGGEQGREVVLGDPLRQLDALAGDDGLIEVARGGGDARVDGLRVREEGHLHDLHDDALQEAASEGHEHGVAGVQGHLRRHGVAERLPVGQASVDRDLYERHLRSRIR